MADAQTLGSKRKGNSGSKKNGALLPKLCCNGRLTRFDSVGLKMVRPSRLKLRDLTYEETVGWLQVVVENQ